MLMRASAATAVLALVLLTGAAGAQQPSDSKTAAKTAASPCAGLEESACRGNSACTWHRETTTKKGQKRKAHCQKKPSRSVKKKA